MRVISGKYKGKKLEGFDIEGTRPTMDRVKESLFGMIQKYVVDSIVLDLFAGSGSLGIEALSMGASKSYFVDYNSKIYNILKKNTSNMDNCILMNIDYLNALNTFKDNNIKFDLIILDPPYKMNLINNCLDKIYEYDLLNSNGIIICEFETEIVTTDYFELLKEKKYGSKMIRIYKRVR